MNMREQMSAELEEMIRTLEKANSALERIFNVDTCAGCGEPYEGEGDCPDCRCSDSCGCTDEERESNMSTCMGCLKDFEESDLVWQHGLLCVDCREGDTCDRDL